MMGDLVRSTHLPLFNLLLRKKGSWKHGGATPGPVRRSRSEWVKGLVAVARRMSFADPQLQGVLLTKEPSHCAPKAIASFMLRSCVPRAAPS